MNPDHNTQELRIESVNDILLIGMKRRMSLTQNRTFELWRHFSPLIGKIQNRLNSNLYSVEIFDDTTFFKAFSPNVEFEKWAAVEVKDFNFILEGMSQLVIPKGLYVVFKYKGKPSEAQEFFQYIYSSWFPGSNYKLDTRPHFALMGEKYKGEDPDSEEEFWIPIKK